MKIKSPLSVNSGKLTRFRTLNIFLKIIAITLAFILISGCYSFFKVTTTKFPKPETVSPMMGLNKIFVVHLGTNVFVIKNFKIENDSVKGIYESDYSFPYKKNTFPQDNSSVRYVKKRGDERLINEVHLYIQDLRTNLYPGYSTKSFALKDIYRLDIYNPDKGRTTLSWIVGFVGGVALVYGSIIIIALLLLLVSAPAGSSCPYIYVNTGNELAFAGEIYSGSIYAPLERNDYLLLPRLVADEGNYKLKISNELEEVQFNNLTELIVIDHPYKSEVLIDKYGNYQTATEIRSPLTATNFLSDDILKVVKGKDSISYCGMTPDNDIPLTDGVIMTFDLPEGAISGKVFLRARNSLWLDYVYKNAHQLFGGFNNNWTKRQNKSDPKELLKWSLDQKIPLSVYIEKNGEWIFCDYFNMAGPAALKDDVIAIDLKGVDRGPLRVKLESGSYFWEIDYVGIDYSLNIPVKLSTVKIDKAITNHEDPVTDFLKYDDLKYYVQDQINDNADLSFRVPPFANAMRTIILHSKGYYQYNYHANGFPHIKKLNAIRKPEKFIEYSRDLMTTKLNDLINSNTLHKY
jgi:hypothetical protein